MVLVTDGSSQHVAHVWITGHFFLNSTAVVKINFHFYFTRMHCAAYSELPSNVSTMTKVGRNDRICQFVYAVAYMGGGKGVLYLGILIGSGFFLDVSDPDSFKILIYQSFFLSI